MILKNGWQQVQADVGCREYRKAYRLNCGVTVFAIRLWESLDRWYITVNCNPMAKGTITTDYIEFAHKPVSKDIESMLNEAEDLAREDFTRLHEFCELAIKIMEV